MTNVQSFVEKWSRVWNGRDSDPDLYLELLQEDCVLVNPLSPMTRDELPQFMESVLAMEPDIRVAATQWAATADGIVFIEWINTGTVKARRSSSAASTASPFGTVRRLRDSPILTRGRSSKVRRHPLASKEKGCDVVDNRLPRSDGRAGQSCGRGQPA